MKSVFQILYVILSGPAHFAGKVIYTCLALLALSAVLSTSQALAINCAELDGAYVYSQEPIPVYLGFFGSENALDSIMNELGPYGGVNEPRSVRNEFGLYGSATGIYSANNNSTSFPPQIYKYESSVGYLTTNVNISGGESLAAIDDAKCTFSATSPAKGSPPVPPPSPPTWVNASDGLYTDKIQVSWAAVTGAAEYNVYSSGSLTGTKDYVESTTDTTINVTGTIPEKLYYFWVSASNDSGEGALSNPDSGYAALIVYILSVNTSGNGTGTVTSLPAGINCGLDCSEVYSDNETVILTASSDLGSRFAGWSGACSGISTTCQVTMDEAKSVTATFTMRGVPWLMLLLHNNPDTVPGN